MGGKEELLFPSKANWNSIISINIIFFPSCLGGFLRKTFDVGLVEWKMAWWINVFFVWKRYRLLITFAFFGTLLVWGYLLMLWFMKETSLGWHRSFMTKKQQKFWRVISFCVYFGHYEERIYIYICMFLCMYVYIVFIYDKKKMVIYRSLS